MHPISQSRINHFHQQRTEKFGELSAEALGWKNKASQQKRFEALVQIGDLTEAVVLDLGCGYGDLKIFLDNRFEHISYLGVDLNQDFIEKANEKYKSSEETHFIQGDFANMNFKGIDYVLASGALSYHNEEEGYHKK